MAIDFNKQLTVKDLLKIDEGRIDRSKQLYKVKFIDDYDILDVEEVKSKIHNSSIKSKKKPQSILHKIFKYQVDSNSGNKYKVFIEVPPSFSFNRSKFLQNKVRVFCNCADFKYRAAYNLSKKDNVCIFEDAEKHLGVALTEPPTKIIPTNICKHLYSALKEFRSKIYNNRLLKELSESTIIKN